MVSQPETNNMNRPNQIAYQPTLFELLRRAPSELGLAVQGLLRYVDGIPERHQAKRVAKEEQAATHLSRLPGVVDDIEFAHSGHVIVSGEFSIVGSGDNTSKQEVQREEQQ